MTNSFGSDSTTDEVLSGIDLRGKRVLVTGTSAGIGIETARALASRGAEVVGTARNLAKAHKATADVRTAAQGGAGSLDLVELDLADLTSVRSCADGLVTYKRPFDIVIANAGVMATPFGRTVDGYETQLGTNHLGHFVLVNRIAPLMRQGGRLVVLSSAAHQIADINLDDPNFERTPYDTWVAYGRSKTACALLAVEFDRRHGSRGIRAAAVHPGGIQTELQRHYTPADEAAMVEAINAANAAKGLLPFRYKSISQGAATSVWAAAVAEADAIGGRYCEDCHVAEIDDSEGIHGGVRSYALSAKNAQALWAQSEDIVGERF